MCAARYKVTRKIADGGMAELYLGVQRGAAGFERPIVIKRVRAAYCADPATREALVDEAHVAMSLIHSNIVQVLDLGFAAGRYFLVLELVDGWDLSVLLERAKHAELPLPPELALHVAAEVCRALAFAHSKTRDGAPLGIVHRDINPLNVLISEQGEVKLTDFGIATARTRRRARTLVGVVKGKLGFMSPEQAKGEDQLDARSDVFSLGCTLYQLATGLTPFAGGTELEMLLRMEQCAFRPLEQARPDLPPELAAIIKKAMQKAPADRFANADELLADLERVQRGAFRPAGQSELKAWLTELARRDQVPTIGRRSAAAPAAVTPGELEPGANLVLEEIESDPGAVVRTISPHPALPSSAPASTPPLPTPSASAPPSGQAPPAATAKVEPRASEHPPTPSAVPEAESKLAPSSSTVAAPERRSTSAPPPPSAAPTERKPTPVTIPATIAAAGSSGRKPTPALQLPAAATPRATTPSPTAPPPPAPAEEFLEPPPAPSLVVYGAIFLAIAVAAMSATVFLARPKLKAPGSAIADGGSQAVVNDPLALKREMAYPSLPPEPHPLSIETVPAGASIAVNGQPAGISPTQMRLQPGRYELRFEKAGYRAVVQRVTIVADKPPEKLSVSLEK
ncbi:MAG: protein kinase [Deltaproteobacteria bacterium]|nr:protein kinase [Deltaproteobacteria bacterium]